jgi:hypothetical protein
MYAVDPIDLKSTFRRMRCSQVLDTLSRLYVNRSESCSRPKMETFFRGHGIPRRGWHLNAAAKLSATRAMTIHAR